MLDTMDATDESSILEHSLYTRPPEELGEGHWGFGRVSLVGDAAHPMRPIAGDALLSCSQGFCVIPTQEG